MEFSDNDKIGERKLDSTSQPIVVAVLTARAYP
jgi:hypothetical protein